MIQFILFDRLKHPSRRICNPTVTEYKDLQSEIVYNILCIGLEILILNTIGLQLATPTFGSD